MAGYDTQMAGTHPLDWSAIDTVLLDMDGTLLDLRFDNWFWREVIPRHYAAAHGLDADEASARLAPRFQAVAGTMRWYCIDYWSEQLGLDIAALKRAARPAVGYLPGAREFLTSLAARGKRRVLVTNAHPTTFAIKNEEVGLAGYFDACHSTHPFAVPKEDRTFWPRFAAREPFDPARTLFVDDSLPVLRAARDYGIAWLRAVRRPDSAGEAQPTHEMASIDGVYELV